MDKNMFAIIMPVIISGLIIKIINETGVNEDEAFIQIYKSKLYEVLEREATKVWTYSIPLLFDLFIEEMTTGNLALPEY